MNRCKVRSAARLGPWRVVLATAGFAAGIAGCAQAGSTAIPSGSDNGTATAATFELADSAGSKPLKLIAYGDMRFTDPAETVASNPAARLALVTRIAEESPAALFLNGDVPWRGGHREDYTEYLAETGPWRDAGLHVFPALGNHEFKDCAEAECLEHWWTAFPELRGRRWYSVAVSAHVRGIALDSTSVLLPGSPQRAWLEQQLHALPAAVRWVVLSIHHPPVADIQTVEHVDHNPRDNERALASLLEAEAAKSGARFIVVAGHIHNYERFDEGGVTYLVSGGGGAKPYSVARTPADRYQDADFPNFHYVAFTIDGRQLSATMWRLANPGEMPARWEARDRFVIDAKAD